MDVAVSTFRSHLSEWLDRAREGEEVVITDRGVPVARLTAVASTPLLERLTAEGVIGRPRRQTRPKATSGARVRARRPVSDLISEQRR